MKRIIMTLFTTTLALWLLPAAAAPSSTAHPDWQFPVIKGYGAALALPNAELQPTTGAIYKVAFTLTRNDSDSKVNVGLQHVARTVNLMALAGVPLDHLKFVVVIHGAATPIVLNNSAYRRIYQHDNPNIMAFDALAAAGIKLLVCGQALGENHVPQDEVYSKIHLSLSALTDLIVLQHEGYVLYPL